MLDRKVLIDGSVYAFHDVIGVHHEARNATTLIVRSHRGNPNLGPTSYTDRVFTLPLDDTMTFADAEAVISELPDFAEYVDPEEALLVELADTLTDEQAGTVAHIYPEWSSHASYAKDERVRYSDGFYRCLQAHDAQESWNPSAAASLWAAIIDASVLPIGEYPLWRQPESTNPYMAGDRVTYDERVWESTIDNNVWAPGVHGWEVVEVDPESEPEPDPEPEPTPDPEPEIPEWSQPDAASAYMMGDRVRFNGKVYESTIDNNVWSPEAYPQGWEEVE